MSNQKKEKEENPQRDFINVYFIENHIQTETVSISLSKNYNEAGELNTALTNTVESEPNYKYTIYCFKVYTKKIKGKKIDIKIKIEGDKGYKSEFNINIKDFERDLFLYDFKYEKVKNVQPKSIDLNYIQIFEIYVSFLRKTLKKVQNTLENEYFIFSTQQQNLIGKQYEFSFYLMIFLECFSTKYVKRLLIMFRKDKIGKIGELPEKKLKPISNTLKRFENNPSQVLDKIEENKRDEYGKYLVGIILFFNYNFHKERMKDIINNEKLKLYMYKAIIEYSVLIPNLQLTKEQVTILINESKNYEQMVDSLKYCTGVLELIETILVDSHFKKICEFYKSELDAKKKPSIDIESMVSTQGNDNMKEIYEKYILLYNKQKETLNNIFINFKPTLCDKYISHFDGVNVNSLIYVKDLIDFMKSKNKKFEVQVKDLNKIIHDTGLKLSKEHKMKNIEILNFISRDAYYNDSNYVKKVYRPLDILNGLDVGSFNDEFYSEWKKFDWSKIFDEQYVAGFLPKVSNFINDLANFNILFKLFDIGKTNNQEDFNNYSLIAMQTRFEELIKASQNPINYNEDLIKLIFYSDKQKANIEDFLTSHLHKILNVDKINEIYIKLMSLHNDLITSNTKYIITEFFTKNDINKNPKSLIYLIENCPELSKNILENITSYNIQKENFLELEENDNLLLFKGLLDKEYIEKNEYENTSYVKNIKTTIKEIENNIKNGEILYKDISKFYNEAEKEHKNNILYDRLKLIALNKEQNNKIYKDKIDNYYSKINETLDDLNLINEDLIEFYYNEKSEDIEKIKKIIDEIKNGKLNIYEKYNKEIDDFKSKYMNEARKVHFFRLFLNPVKKNIMKRIKNVLMKLKKYLKVYKKFLVKKDLKIWNKII